MSSHSVSNPSFEIVDVIYILPFILSSISLLSLASSFLLTKSIFLNMNHLSLFERPLSNEFNSLYKVLISLFPYNQILLTKYYELSKNLKYSNWILFFEILLFEKNNMKQRLIQLSDNTEDYNLKKIIKIYI